MVDIITNSSSEIFVFANKKSIETIKKLIDNLLKIGGSALKCDNLFEIDLVMENLYCDDGIERKNVSVDDPIYGKEVQKKIKYMEENGEGYSNIIVSAKPKDINIKLTNETKIVLEILNNLHTLLLSR